MIYSLGIIIPSFVNWKDFYHGRMRRIFLFFSFHDEMKRIRRGNIIILLLHLMVFLVKENNTKSSLCALLPKRYIIFNPSDLGG
jgi:hypothetical protein